MIHSKKENNVTTISFNGMESLDAQNATDVKDELKSLINEKSAQVVLNLKGVNFIDSSGFGAIISALKNAKRAGGNMKICNVSENAQELFRLMSLDNVFEFFVTEEKCQASY
tara:strand:- start:7987 stop:8322 length:336 start_codon:yes stop_codon:yes gene_type:complete